MTVDSAKPNFFGKEIREGIGGFLEAKKVSQSKTVKAMLVLPPDSNALGTMFGGKVMSYIDDVASITAFRHARQQVVTASTDSVDFLHPINVGSMVCMESFVTWVHKTSMEVYVSVISEDLKTGERRVCASAFLTFVAIDEHGDVIGRAKPASRGRFKTGHFERGAVCHIPSSGGSIWRTNSKWLLYMRLSGCWTRTGRTGGLPGNWGFTVRRWPGTTG